jgi:hypothetical protein
MQAIPVLVQEKVHSKYDLQTWLQAKSQGMYQEAH